MTPREWAVTALSGCRTDSFSLEDVIASIVCEAVLEEREACAKVAEAWVDLLAKTGDSKSIKMSARIAGEIRIR